MFSRDQEALRIFVAELNVLKKLSHVHLVKYIGYDIHALFDITFL
jgi:hypothetical protein